MQLCPQCRNGWVFDTNAIVGVCNECDHANWADDMERRTQIEAWEAEHGCPLRGWDKISA